MPLDFSNGGSSTLTGGYIRYMASTSSWQSRGEPFKFGQAVMDLENIRTGWCYIAEGTAPEWVMDGSLKDRAAKPQGEGWKRGFKVDVFSKSMFGEDEPVKEWATNATGATMGIQALYAEYERSREEGKVPVVEFVGATPTKVGKGNTNVPNFKIVKYVDRPVGLGDDDAFSAPVSIPSSEAQTTEVLDAEF